MLEMALIYLAAAVVAVPIAKRFGLGSVLGYLLAGVLIGPFLLGLVGDQTEVMHGAEFGVVMMLFLIGLELHPSRLWKLRHSILGLGGLQVTTATLAIFAIALVGFEWAWQSALALGLMLSLSSTAIVMQTLDEKGWRQHEGGMNSFSVLLFQDIAIIPMLALLPLLALNGADASDVQGESWISDWSAMGKVLVTIGVVATIILAGKYVANPIFRYIAETRLREVFTFFALFLVIAIALVMQKIGLSPALGTFLAGVVLAESEFRHELEADIEPFKALLLGVFFITVGASIDFGLLFDEAATVLALVAALILVKACLLYLLAYIFRIRGSQQWLFTLALAQGGEFAFVLLTATSSLALFTDEQSSMITLVVSLSMLCAPLLLMLFDQVQRRQNSAQPAYDKAADITASQQVIIAGYGRFGQIIGRLLAAQGYEITVLDHSPSQIELLRRFGNTVFYGDAARKDLLEAAGADRAKLLVIAIDNPDKTLDIVQHVKQSYPHLKVAARAKDRRHAYQLMRLNVHAFNRETFDSAIMLGIDALKLLGNDEDDARRAGKLFREHDIKTMQELAEVWGDEKSYGVAVKQRQADLKQVLAEDREAQRKLKTCGK